MNNSKFQAYQNDLNVPETTLAWNLYGAGTQNIGKDGKPERFPVPQPGGDQLLVRVDAVGLCYSDVKLIRLGGDHPKLYGRDLAKEPTRVGHEVALTVIKVGKDLAGKYRPGQRLAVQPDIYHNQRSTAYGYTISGGLIQFHLIGPEVLDADDGAYVIPLDEHVGYAEAALTEPWACVDAAYTQRRRLEPKEGGVMWIVGNARDQREYTFEAGLDAPALIYLTEVSAGLEKIVRANAAQGARIVKTDTMTTADFADFSTKETDGKGFDDIILLAPQSGELVGEIAKLIAFRGMLNIVSDRPLEGDAQIDAGRIHYHYTAYVGNKTTDISASYGEARNRCELRPGGCALFVGAGGPMGQMHVQRAIEKKDGPAVIIASELKKERADVLLRAMEPLAKAKGKIFKLFNPSETDQSLGEFIKDVTGEDLVDDAVICVPVAQLMAESARLLKPDGMLVCFAGVPNGTYIDVDLSPVYLGNQQITGTSGSSLLDQEVILRKTLEGDLNPNRSVAAIGGMGVAQKGLEALINGTYAGKIIIFPQLNDLPLLGLEELSSYYPRVAEKLGENALWTLAAEQALIEELWPGSAA
ncbi:alcohol dehydrogenase catalytic domain-containing protein [Pelolinea submarina]|uniref:D-arabinose 1-dehydrogenase-like Zn-dependent alcohol dehydrogenase n=1 Tax=Pelolinea submarina TaxID=913107 RepID=A0A347ZWJ9_9CHLR|nr:alcohol dehydrogenase catalytic domain-containing protein [Pelolinea submarina]REG05422.1 D-arabinose 1-dehydrogenase-like Zn-dependent alcohol dehydrogenase [Pelolinea submarina]BBB49680.1 L-sorbose 1-phosphate reductase [Pelolinea submarina]